MPFSWPSSDPAVQHITALDMEAVDRRLGVRSAGSSSLAQRFTAPERDVDGDHRVYDDSDDDEFVHSVAYRSWVEEVFEKELGDPDEAWLRE